MKYKVGDRVKTRCVVVQAEEDCTKVGRDYKGCDRGTVQAACRLGYFVTMDNGHQCGMCNDEIVGLAGGRRRLWK
jgi:hypothetical protein